MPLHLLVFAFETAITTMTCLSEAMSWTELSSDEKLRLGSVYGPYLAFCRSSFTTLLILESANNNTNIQPS
jgi:hypothetical protein